MTNNLRSHHLQWIFFASFDIHVVTRADKKKMLSNPFLTNEFAHHYQLCVSTFLFMGARILILIRFFDGISLCKQNSSRWDAVFCLTMSRKKDIKLMSYMIPQKRTL